MSAKPKAFFLTAESPYPLIGGGALRTASILEYLYARYDTDVFCFEQPDAGENLPSPPAWGYSHPESRACRWTTKTLAHHRKDTFSKAARNFNRFMRGVPPLVDRFSGHEQSIAAAICGKHYDLAIVEHFWCAPYSKVLRPHCRKLVLDLHNIESVWHRRAAELNGPPASWMHRRFASAAESLERRILGDFDQIFVTSKPECKFLSEFSSDPVVNVVPNTIPVVPMPQLPRGYAVAFSGNMEYMPNWTAVEHFAREIWPLVTRQHPETRWKIVGKAADRFLRISETDSRVELVPNPSDAIMELASVSVAVVPLLLGTGTRLKIVEAWAAGTPVVSTSVGAEGLEFQAGEDLLLSDDVPGFAAAIGELLRNPPLAERIGRSGRVRYESAYSWERTWESLSASGI